MRAMTDFKLAEVFPPGEFLAEELEERGWSQADLADILACPARLISEIVSGKRAITTETAKGLSEAFGSSAEMWLNLQSQYSLYRLSKSREASVSRRAQLYAKAPVREMVRRNWIEGSKDIDVLEHSVMGFLGIASLDETPDVWRHAARKSTSYDHITPPQWAWLVRAKELGRMVDASACSKKSLGRGLDQLKMCLAEPEEIRNVPRILAEAGVRLVVLEPFRGSKIDGATVWLDNRSPVVALSFRYDRINWFWHTLMHELGHVLRGDGLTDDSIPFDVDLFGASSAEKPEAEQLADRFAQSFLVDPAQIEDFVTRVSPLFSKTKIVNFARRIGVHPGIVVGQLQFSGVLPWTHSQNLLVKVRDIVLPSALTDGWEYRPTA